MRHQIESTIRRFVDRVAGDHEPTEVNTAKVPDAVVVIAGNVHNPYALAGHSQDFLDDIVVRLGPEPAGPQFPTVNDVADQVQRLAIEFPDKFQQQLCLTAAGTQMNVRDERSPAANGRASVRHVDPPISSSATGSR